jgi:agmatine deiminase
MKTQIQTAHTSQNSVPAEWATQKALWAAWPSDADIWLDDLDLARREIAAMLLAIAQDQPVKLVASGTEAIAAAKAMVNHANVEVFDQPIGDIWFRDTGPIFGYENGEAVALRFQVNGWGGKYDYPADRVIGDFIARTAGKRIVPFDLILEGGSIENDGEGTLLTTRECLLNPNRNPDKNAAEIEDTVKKAFGANKLLWLDFGLLNDHTDGHIDNIARFIAPGKVVCQTPFGADDPNTETLNKIIENLSAMTDAKGRKLEVITIPSPGLVYGYDDEIIAASHMNFIIANRVVIVPTYGTESEQAAVSELQKHFPTRRVIGLSSLATLRNGGGSFHCMTQQEPL